MKNIFSKTLIASIFAFATMLSSCNSNDPVFNESAEIPRICDNLTKKTIFDIVQELHKHGYTKIKKYSKNDWVEINELKINDFSENEYYRYLISNHDESIQWEIHYGDTHGNNIDDICKSFIVHKYFNTPDREIAKQITKKWSEYMFNHYKKESDEVRFRVSYGKTEKNSESKYFRWFKGSDSSFSLRDNYKSFSEMLDEKVKETFCDWGISYQENKEYTILFSASWNERERFYLSYYYTNYQIEAPTVMVQ